MDISKGLDSNVQTYQINNDADVHPMDMLDPTGVLVKPKWRRTPQDKLDMKTLGRHQVLQVRKQPVIHSTPNSRSVDETE